MKTSFKNGTYALFSSVYAARPYGHAEHGPDAQGT